MSGYFRLAIVTGLLATSACATAPSEEDDDLAFATSQTRQGLTFADRTAACATNPLVVAGVMTQQVCVGADLFFRETFNGNGRSCGTCHPVANNFTIDPRFIATLPDNDPLFVAEFNPALAQLEKPAIMRSRSLILENVDGFTPDPTTKFVMRSVPHTLSLSTSITRDPADPNSPTSPPVDRTGWSGDGAPGTGSLRDFQTGAIMQHYTKSLDRVAGTDFRLATSDELDAIDQFMRQTGRSNDLVLANVKMLDTRAENGRTVFLAVGCNACHGNAGANITFAPNGKNRNFNTGVESARDVALAGIPHDGGFGVTLDPIGSAAGPFGNGTFNVPPLVEAADTPPFFHVSETATFLTSGNPGFAADSIEEAISFYSSTQFNASPSGLAGPIHMTTTQIQDVGRFLRGLNASFNAALTIKRLDAAAKLVTQFGVTQNAAQQQNLLLAKKELQDAQGVLSAIVGLNADAQASFAIALTAIDAARTATTAAARTTAIGNAKGKAQAGSAQIGTSLTYTIGTGSVAF